MNGKKKAPYRLCHLAVLVGWRNEKKKAPETCKKKAPYRLCHLVVLVG